MAVGDIPHFFSIPWCAKHLGAPGLVIETAPSRVPQSTTEHELFARTLNTSSTISHFVVAYPRPRDAGAPVLEITAFLTLGPGINGYAGVCHGGVVATILDEVMGFLSPINHGRATFQQTNYMTAYLNTQYQAPVLTPSTIMVVMRVARQEGRKVFLEGHIEDERGTVLAKGDALYLGLKTKL